MTTEEEKKRLADKWDRQERGGKSRIPHKKYTHLPFATNYTPPKKKRKKK